MQTKIKKIIQENQDIGKLSNLVPPLVEQSLEFFLVDLLKKCEEVAQEHNITKLTPPILKKALLELENYDFLKDALDDVEDISSPIPSKSKISAPRQPKRSKPEVEAKEEKQKRGRKKQKASGES
jgi:predicted transcriptional regulator